MAPVGFDVLDASLSDGARRDTVDGDGVGGGSVDGVRGRSGSELPHTAVGDDPASDGDTLDVSVTTAMSRRNSMSRRGSMAALDESRIAIEEDPFASLDIPDYR